MSLERVPNRTRPRPRFINNNLYAGVQHPPFSYAINVYLKGEICMDSENGTASNAIWAVAMIIIVAMIVGGVYYISQTGSSQKKVDINVTAPAR